MSSAPGIPAVIPAPERVPPAVGSTVTALWLSIGTGLIAMGALWPAAINAAPAVMGNVERGSLASFGWMVFGCTSGFILLVGLFLSFIIARRNRKALRYLRTCLLGGMLAGLGIVGGAIFMIMQDKGAAPLGPAYGVTGIALGITLLLPFMFAGLALSYSGLDEVENYFQPESPAEVSEEAGVVVSPAEEEVVVTEAAPEGEVVTGEFESGAVVAPVDGQTLAEPTGTEGLEEIFEEQPPAEGAGIAEVVPEEGKRPTQLGQRSRETMLRPEPAGTNVTMVQPPEAPPEPPVPTAGDAFDAIFDEVVVEQTATTETPEPAAPPAQETPMSPDALEQLFEGEQEARTPEPEARPEEQGTFSDSIFDEEILPPLPTAGPSDSSGFLESPSQHTATGESSIFSEIGELGPESSVSSQAGAGPGVPEVVPEDPDAEPPARPKGRGTMIQPKHGEQDEFGSSPADK